MKKYLLVLALIFLLFSYVWGEDLIGLVNSDWLEKHLKDPDVRIVDVRTSINDYWSGHIPGAVYLNPEALRLADHGIPGRLMPKEILVLMLGEMGIDNKTQVVIYAENSDFKPTYLAWALEYLGHQKIKILEEGFTKWEADKKPTTQDYPQIMPKKYEAEKIDAGIRADLKEVKESLNKNDVIILDVRPAEVYKGEKGNWKRLGHIPKALNHYWELNITKEGMWKPKEELKKEYQDQGVTPGKKIIVSCGQGIMSTHTYFTLKHILGYPNVKNYDGSFNEWSSYSDLPVEK